MMGKGKAFLVTGLVAAVVGAGALASAPAASAKPLCDSYASAAKVAHDLYIIYRYYGDYANGNYYMGMWAAYSDAAIACALDIE
jgi:hypothetical protein